MTHSEIRKKFFEYFRAHDHAIVPSSSLIPSDPSVLLTTAGMQQFKPYYTGEADAMRDFGSPSAASIQKCFRTSDIDEVGDDTHLTFFEMVGNFSFGGYFKREAIELAHGFLTKELDLDISYVTVFEGSASVPKDDESRAIWNELGVTDVREEGMESVFWGPTGASGPCGPTTEIYCKNASGQDVEIWNVVFNEYFCTGSRDELSLGKAELKPLVPKGIDTGMGLERLTMIVQRVENIFETDLFSPILSLISRSCDDRTRKIIADHARAITFLISDNVHPSNKGAGYILRRLMRRLISYQYLYNIGNPPEKLFECVINNYSSFYKDDNFNADIVIGVFKIEYERFMKTLDVGLKEFFKKYPEMKVLRDEAGKGYKLHQVKIISGEDVFFLHQTYGLTIDIIKDLAKRGGHSVDEKNFEKEFAKHQAISRAGAEKKFGGHGLLLDTGELKAATAEEAERATRLHTATHLLQAALRKVLGPEIHQMGSDITAERLRFDFNFLRKLTEEELRLTEEFVNSVIERDLSVTMKEEDFDMAVKGGALAFFKGKYPARVRVYSMGDVSEEVCGGPHVAQTGEIGHFKILKDEAVAAGVRRIRATIN